MAILADIRRETANLKPSLKDLRKFGLTFLVILGLLAGLLFWRGSAATPWFLALALIFGAWGLFWPGGLKPVYRAWMTFAIILGAVMARVLLTILYYLVVTPIGLIMRLFGKDILDTKMKDRDSYWHKRPDEPYDPVRTEKMY